ncbi:MAG: Holliday junction branch migration protein RuvA [Deltaproteobacteria bacterium]|nr:Holliday junction branch migration protein RuvA [Deltaproteobacteria bacterium]
MIGRLTGSVAHEDADGIVVLDVGGVGYEVMVPAGTIARARLAGGGDDRVTLWVHSHVREDAFLLFGFATFADRAVFRTLLGISSVGPRTAISLLSSISSSDLARAVQSRDAAALVKIPGVGKKTAERLILELKDKLSTIGWQVDPAGAASSVASRSSGPKSAMVVDALTRLGFKPAEAERAVASLGEAAETDPMDKAIRDALTVLRR